MKNVLLAGALVFICSCGNSNSTGISNATTAASIDSISSMFIVDTIGSSFTDTMGAGCFYYDSVSGGGLVFYSGVDSTAYVSLNGKLAAFRLVDRQEIIVNDSMANYNEVYHSGRFEIRMYMEQGGGSREFGVNLRGTMILKDNSCRETTKKITGYCGC